MPSTDYIPRDDADFRDWATTFASRIALNPSVYMLTSAQSASITLVVNNFVAAYVISVAEATRTKGTIADKNDARAVAEGLCRQYAMQIKENAGIADSDKIYIGVRPENPDRQPRERPQTSPIISILGNTPGSQTLVFADSTTPDSKAKPFGATELQLWRAVTTADAAPLDEAEFIGKFTKNPVAIEFSQDEDGKVATYYARWAGVRGDTGPWSLPISMRIAA